MKRVPSIESKILRVAYAVWETIAYDAIQLLQEAEGRSYLKGDEVIEFVADYMDSHGRRIDAEAVEAFLAMEYEVQEKLLAKQFKKGRRYGY